MLLGGERLGIKLACLIIVGLVCSYTDIKRRLIYNKVTVPAILAGPCLNAVLYGTRGLFDSLGGFLLAFIISLLIALPGFQGGGDLKMNAAFGAIGGTRFALYCLLYTAVIEGVVSLVILVRTKKLRECLAAVTNYGLLILKGVKASMPSFGTFPHAPWLTIGGVLAAVSVL